MCREVVEGEKGKGVTWHGETGHRPVGYYVLLMQEDLFCFPPLFPPPPRAGLFSGNRFSPVPWISQMGLTSVRDSQTAVSGQLTTSALRAAEAVWGGHLAASRRETQLLHSCWQDEAKGAAFFFNSAGFVRELRKCTSERTLRMQP